MGNSSSANPMPMSKFYGGSETFGGIEDLDKYDVSAMSSKKRGLIKEIAEILGDKLKIDGLKNAKSQDVSTTVKLLRECIPDPRRGGNGKRFSSDKDKQEEACRVLADAINSRMGNIISTKLSASELCQQVSETMYSLFTSISGELMTARDDLKRVIGNLTALKELTDRQYKALQNKMTEEDSGILPAETTLLSKIHGEVLQEFDRQLVLLQNMLDVIVPHTEEELMILLKESDDMKRLVKRVRKYPGTVEFGRKLSYLMGGFKTTAEAALIVDNALKQLGISYKEYAKVENHKDLTKLLSRRTVEALGKKDSELSRYEAAKLRLYKHQYMHDDIVKLLEAKQGSYEEVVGGLKVDKRIKKRQNLKRVLLEDFNRQVSALISEILISAKIIAQSFGTTQMVSDNTLKFVKALEAMPDISRKYTYFSVIGIIDDVRSRKERADFSGSVKYVIDAIDRLIKDGSPVIDHLKSMKNGLEKMSEIIDAFARKFSEGFGPLESWDSYKKSESVEGSNDTISGDISTEIARIGYTLREAIDTIIYYHRISLMRYNIGKSSKELTAYQSGYNKILGDAIANAIDTTKKEMLDWEELTKISETLDKSKDLSLYYRFVYRELLDERELAHDSAIWSNLEAAINNSNNSKHADYAKYKQRKSEWEEIKKYGVERFNSKINMYRTAEALDIYLKEFTNGIASNPDDIQDIVKMLNNIEINAAWYSGTSGDIIINVFEAFPRANTKTDLAFNKYSYPPLYNPTNYGNPFIGNIFASDSKDAKNGAKYALKEAMKAENCGALKNIISIFVSLGDKFNGKEIIRQTHMPAKLMVKYLHEYIAHSAFHMGITSDGKCYDLHANSWSYSNTNDRTKVGGYGNTMRSTRGKVAIVMRPIDGLKLKSLIDNDIFTETDRLFTYSLKAIIAKILTVVGMHNIMRAPIQRDGIGYDSKIRAVIGGFEAKPKIIPEATELYIRLPLLAEFYRSVFDIDDASNGITEDNICLTMIPEIDGTFSGLITLVFDKAKSVTNGTYSDTEISYLITEINKIYSKFSKSANPIMDSINEFISEINRRYGLMASSEKAKYLEEVKSRYETAYNKPADQIDIALRGIDEDDVYRRPAPSDSYMTFGTLQSRNSHKYKISDVHKKLVFLARQKMDSILRNVEHKLISANSDASQSDLKNITFGFLVKSKQDELSKAKNNDESFDIIRSAISSMGAFSSSALEKSYIMFHETVVMGLHTLYKIYEKLHTFILFMEKAASLISYYKKHNGKILGISDIPVTVADQKFVKRYFLTTGKYTKIYKDVTLQSSQNIVYKLDLNALLTDFCDKLCEHTAYSNKLCGIQIYGISSGTREERKLSISIDNSKMRELVYSLHNQVKQFIDRYRGVLPNDVIIYYENADKCGSIYWIEKKLINELLENKSFEPVNNLDKASRDIQFIADFLVAPLDGIGKYAREIPNKTKDVDTSDHKMRYNYFDAFSAMIYCYNEHHADDILKKLSYYKKVQQNTKNKGDNYITVMQTDSLLQLFINNTGKSHNGVEPNKPYNDSPESAPVFGLFNEKWNFGKTKYEFKNGGYTDISYDNSRGVIHLFNKLLVSYLYTIYDDHSKSCYITTLNKFANSQFNSAIFDHKNNAFKIKSATASNFYINWEHKMPICEHVAYVIKQIVSLKAVGSLTLMISKSDLAEIPIYLRERMKANLPVYKKLFAMLIGKCKVLRDLLMVLNVEGLNVIKDLPYYQKNKGGFNIIKTTTIGHDSEDNVRRRFGAALDKIISGCTSLIQCINDTLHDLADTPKYIEFNDNFIQTYESANGILPIMPLSTLTSFYGAARTDIMPIGRLGNNGFKLLYGTRKIMCSNDFDISDLPWVQQFTKVYNNSVDLNHGFKEDEMNSFIQNTVNLLRYYVDSNNYGSEFCVNYIKTNIYGANITAITKNKITYGNITLERPLTILHSINFSLDKTEVNTYQSQVDTVKSLNITESSDQKKSNILLASKISNANNNNMNWNTRDDLIGFNIVDLNIFPININALAREMPLVHLYNYAYSFNQYVNRAYLANHAHRLTESYHDNSTDMIAYLLDPYSTMHNKEMYSDPTSVSLLNIPRYIKDELLDKSLKCMGRYKDDNDHSSNIGKINNIIGGGQLCKNVLDYMETTTGAVKFIDHQKEQYLNKYEDTNDSCMLIPFLDIDTCAILYWLSPSNISFVVNNVTDILNDPYKYNDITNLIPDDLVNVKGVATKTYTSDMLTEVKDPTASTDNKILMCKLIKSKQWGHYTTLLRKIGYLYTDISDYIRGKPSDQKGIEQYTLITEKMAAYIEHSEKITADITAYLKADKTLDFSKLAELFINATNCLYRDSAPNKYTTIILESLNILLGILQLDKNRIYAVATIHSVVDNWSDITEDKVDRQFYAKYRIDKTFPEWMGEQKLLLNHSYKIYNLISGDIPTINGYFMSRISLMENNALDMANEIVKDIDSQEVKNNAPHDRVANLLRLYAAFTLNILSIKLLIIDLKYWGYYEHIKPNNILLEITSDTSDLIMSDIIVVGMNWEENALAELRAFLQYVQGEGNMPNVTGARFGDDKLNTLIDELKKLNLLRFDSNVLTHDAVIAIRKGTNDSMQLITDYNATAENLADIFDTAFDSYDGDTNTILGCDTIKEIFTECPALDFNDMYEPESSNEDSEEISKNNESHSTSSSNSESSSAEDEPESDPKGELSKLINIAKKQKIDLERILATMDETKDSDNINSIKDKITNLEKNIKEYNKKIENIMGDESKPEPDEGTPKKIVGKLLDEAEEDMLWSGPVLKPKEAADKTKKYTDLFEIEKNKAEAKTNGKVDDVLLQETIKLTKEHIKLCDDTINKAIKSIKSDLLEALDNSITNVKVCSSMCTYYMNTFTPYVKDMNNENQKTLSGNLIILGNNIKTLNSTEKLLESALSKFIESLTIPVSKLDKDIKSLNSNTNQIRKYVKNMSDVTRLDHINLSNSEGKIMLEKYKRVTKNKDIIEALIKANNKLITNCTAEHKKLDSNKNYLDDPTSIDKLRIVLNTHKNKITTLSQEFHDELKLINEKHDHVSTWISASKYVDYRFSTKFIRNLIWITELHRFIRSELQRKLLTYNSKLVSGPQMTATGITETYSNYPVKSITLENYNY